MDFLVSQLTPDAAIAADGDETIDLPVNPLSALAIEISPLNDTGTTTEYAFLTGLLAGLTNVQVQYLGANIVQASAQDLAALALWYHKVPIFQASAVNTNNDRRSLILPVLFGRRGFMATECLPRTRKGELDVTLTWDIAATGFDGMRRSLVSLELPGATPESFQKLTTSALTFGATGQQDIDLPIGNVLRGCLLFGSTGFEGATPDTSFGTLELLVNNLQRYYSGARWSPGRAVSQFAGGMDYPPGAEHFHGQEATTPELNTNLPEVTSALAENYALLNLDPMMDDAYSLDTAGSDRVVVRTDAGGADAVRVLPIERVDASTIPAV